MQKYTVILAREDSDGQCPMYATTVEADSALDAIKAAITEARKQDTTSLFYDALVFEGDLPIADPILAVEQVVALPGADPTEYEEVDEGEGLPSMDRARAIAEDVEEDRQRQAAYDAMGEVPGGLARFVDDVALADAAQGPEEGQEFFVEDHPEWEDDYRHLVLDLEGNIHARCCDGPMAQRIAELLSEAAARGRRGDR